MNIPRPTMSVWKVALLWAVALGCSLALDRPVSRVVRGSSVPGWLKESRTAAVLTAPGFFRFVAVVAVVAGLLHPRRIRATTMVMAAGAWGGVGVPLKWVVGRARPRGDELWMSFKPFHNGWAGLAEHARYSFPSAQTLLAFTTAAALAILSPRWRWAFYGGATVVALERLAENAHWLSDCVGAAGLGVVGVRVLWNPVAALAERAFNPQNVGQ